MSPSIDQFARDIAGRLETHERQIKALSNKSDLGMSSIDDGGAIDVNSPAGTPTASFGTQYDGTTGAVTLSSPKPPAPTTPVLSAEPGMLTAGWDGFFVNVNGIFDQMIVAPLGFAYVEAHAAPAAAGPDFDARTTVTLIGTIHSARGGAVLTTFPPGDYYVKLISRTTAGKPSDPGPAALITVPALVNTTALQGELLAARDDIAAAELRLDAAEGDLDLAFGLLDALPSDAQAKADAAAAAALQSAKEYAEAVASGVSGADLEALKADMQAKADAAKQAAIAAAAADATAKMDLAKQAAAADATQKADTAKQAALDAVGLKGEIIVQISAPTGTKAAPQNLWIRLPDNTPHRWNPASSLVNKWEAVTDKVATDAALAVVTAQKRADDAYALAGTAGSTANSALQSANGKTKVYRNLSAPSGSGTTAGDIWWQYADATWRVVIGEWTWDGDSWEVQQVSHQTIASVDIGSLTVIGTATISNLVAERIAARTASIQQADIANLTVTGTSTLADVVAQKIAADTGKFMYLTADKIDVNSLYASQAFVDRFNARMATFLTNTNASGYTSVVDGRGLKVVYNVVDEFGVVTEQQTLVSLGTWDEDLIAVRNGGAIVAAIDSQGRVSGTEGNFSESLIYKGQEISDAIDDGARGPLYKAELSTSVDYIGQSDSPYGLVEAQFTVRGDRQVKIEGGILFYPNGTDTEVTAKVTYTIDGTAPTINSPVIAGTFPLGKTNGTVYDHKSFQHSLKTSGTWAEGTVVRMLMVIWRGPGADLRVNSGHDTYLYLTDIGAGIPYTRNHNNGGGRLWPPTATPAPAPVPAKVTNTAEWGYKAVRSYVGSNAVYNYDTGRAYQGQSPAGYGNLKAMYQFPDFAPWISGSTINYIEVYLRFDHWYYNAGGTARIYVHGYLNSLPTTADTGVSAKTVSGWARGTGKWVRLPSSLHAGFLSGSYRGVSLVGDSTYQTYGIASNCRVRINYTK